MHFSRPNNTRLPLTQAPGKWHSTHHSCPNFTGSEHLMFLFIYKLLRGLNSARVHGGFRSAADSSPDRCFHVQTLQSRSGWESNEKTTDTTEGVDAKTLIYPLQKQEKR